MRRYFLPSLVLIIGLIASQIVFTIIVYLSNLSLYQNLSAIKAAGYLIVPNSFILPTLINFKSAFYGAVFFTLTAGAGITLLTFILILMWRASEYGWLMCSLILVFWACLILSINFKGPNLIISLAFIIIQLSTAIAALFLMPSEAGFSQIWRFVTHIIILILILAVWFPYLKNDPFITLRDNFLLGNPIGQKINNFYYQYTMYPAEVFKPLDQKLLKTCKLHLENEKLFKTVENKLRQMDYLIIDATIPPDLTVVEKDRELLFIHGDRIIFEKSGTDFMADPVGTLKEFSKKCDNYSFFRKFTFLSLLIALPLSIYLLIHALIMFLFSSLFSARKSFFLSSFFCLILFVGMVIPMPKDFPNKMTIKEKVKILGSDNWRYRTEALKFLAENNICVEPYMNRFNYKNLTYIPEKYWFAQSLAACKSEETYKILLQYLADSNPNVVCMALYSLGKRDQVRAISEIIQLILSSDHWYEQWYAYKALKRLGWTQNKSEQFR